MPVRQGAHSGTSKPSLIEELLDLQIPHDIRLSPNSQQVVYSTNLTWGHKRADCEHAESTLWLAETGKEHSSRPLTEGDYDDRDPKWCSGGKSIAFLSDRGKRGESCAIYMLDVDGNGQPAPLTPAGNERQIEKFELSPDKKTIAYLSSDEKTQEEREREEKKDDANVWGEHWPFNRLRLINVASKEVTVLVSKDAHIVDFAFNDEGTQIVMAEAQTPDIESRFLQGTTFSVVDVTTGSLLPLCRFPQYTAGLAWAGDTIFLVGMVAETMFNSALCVWKINIAAVAEAGKARYERYAYGESNDCMQLRKIGGDVIALVEEGMEDQLRVLDGHTLFARKREIEAWDAAFPSDSDEVVLALAQSAVNQPTEVYSTTASGGAMVQLSSHGQRLSHQQFGTCTFISCPSLDGKVTLECPLLLPSSISQQHLPTVVLPHGGPYYRHTETFDGYYMMWAPFLLAHGYAVLLADYRGSDGRGEKWAAYARGTGKADYEDVIAQTNRAVELGYADPERLAVGGWSSGGFLTNLAAVRNGTHGLGWKYKAAIPGAGICDQDAMTFMSDVGCWQAELAGAGRPWQLPKSNVRNRQGSAIWEFHEALKAGVEIPPLLILHGEMDDRIPIGQAVAMRRAMIDAGLPFEFVSYPRERHYLLERRHQVDCAERVLRWVDRWIGKP
ncbi:hypothetical protein BAUCODRAFT_121487 [Baudoinia panamericana UAMH 10762]|uniref:Dipeptidyl-peptidase V n=1 Tax=Baudoinia panamericana (strain UAMH 10762) TaxID=717646 RepID=M2NDG7_BAUPA|nr:uncharacterized protein BAUCODRAFT_121487 [Baudoinia panamericana UAMH 10762]EMC96955.1 hypothetical protein BAUCODRAFT_121487 [Baudoinia panamericana UAMH 10762]